MATKPKISFYKITKDLSSIPYKLGSWDKKQGLDCLSVMMLLLERMGIKVEQLEKDYFFEFKGKKITKHNYKDLDKKSMNECLIEFIKESANKVKDLRKGDLAIIKSAGHIFVGIYTGQGTYLTAFEKEGCKIIKLKDFNILEIYRWQLQDQ